MCRKPGGPCPAPGGGCSPRSDFPRDQTAPPLASGLLAQRGIFLADEGATGSLDPLGKTFFGWGWVAALPPRPRARALPAGMLATPACADVASCLGTWSKTGGFRSVCRAIYPGCAAPLRALSLLLAALCVNASGLVPLACDHKLYIASRLNKRGCVCCFNCPAACLWPGSWAWRSGRLRGSWLASVWLSPLVVHTRNRSNCRTL